jgi:riboflavin synthase
MFTGLIAERGTLVSLRSEGAVWRLGVEAPRLVDSGLRVGDSVAVHGICLTVVELRPPAFFLEAVAETRSRSTLAGWRPGEKLNLERALRLADGLDGHLVAGHVDGVATVAEVASDGEARLVRLRAPRELMRYIAAKGSVALDGISLTVAALHPPDGFTVALIPHTLDETSGRAWSPGTAVNLEVDLIARYLERLGNFPPPDALDLEKLRRAGF